MALSNIFREPKRELIEQAFGFLAVLGFVAVDFAVACLLVWWFDGTFHVRWLEFLMGMVLGLPLIFAAWGLLIGMHIIGELVCDTMAARGRDPRPRDRR